MRKHDALWLARRAGSKDERSDALRVDALRQHRDALVFGLFVRQRKNVFIRPEASAALLLKQFAKRRMVVDDGLAANDPCSISCASKVENLVRGTFGIAGNASGAGFQHAEISHTPFRRVAADEQYAVTRFNALAGEKAGYSRGQFAKVGVSVLLLASIALDAHRHPGCVALGRSFEELEQIAICVNTLRLCSHLVFERRKHPLRESRQVNVEPVVVPVKLLRIPGQQRSFVFTDALEKIAHVV